MDPSAGVPRDDTSSAWHPDPFQRHEQRWFDGERWTSHVADNGVTSIDPPTWEESTGSSRAPDAGARRPNHRGKRPLGSRPGQIHGDALAVGEPVPRKGWQLLILFGLLVIGGHVLPFAAVSGQSASVLAEEPVTVVPPLVIAVGAIAAGIAARKGYDVAMALGAGTVMFIAVAAALAAPLIKALFDLSNLLGESVQPQIGLVMLVAAIVVGLLAAIPALASVGDADENARLPVGVALLGSGGVAVYTWWFIEPAFDDHRDLFVGDWYFDVFILAFLGTLIVPGALLLIFRTGAAAALLGGVLLLPVTALLVETFIDAPTHRSFELDPIYVLGLIAALAAAAIGTFGYARRAERDGDDIRLVPARSSGAATVTIGCALVLFLAAYIASSQDDFRLDDEIFVDDVFSTDLDELARECRGGSMLACDELYWSTPSGSTLERLAMSCGDRDTSRQYRGTCFNTFGY